MVVQQGKAPAVKSDELRVIPRAGMVEGESQFQEEMTRFRKLDLGDFVLG